MLYFDAGVPKYVRRRILEAAVRAPQEWHRDAILAAYTSEDDQWKLTAVFCMSYVSGFDEQILTSLESSEPLILYHAVCAAGYMGVDAAWPHIAALVASPDTEKDLLLAAIEAAVNIRPHEASEILGDLLESEDEDIAEAVIEAMAMGEAPWDDVDEDELNS